RRPPGTQSGPAAGGGSAEGRRAVRRKGGRLARGTAGAEAGDLLTEGGVVVAEAVGDVLLPAAVDEDGAESLVEALGVSVGLKEETAGRGVVHHGSPGCDS